MKLAPYPFEDIRIGLTSDSIRRAFLDNLFYLQGRLLDRASLDDQYKALSYSIRDRILHRWVATVETYRTTNCRTVAYLSAEFLPGPFLANNLLALGITKQAHAALAELGVDLDKLIAYEPEPGLGNGGLGRLAACFMDSLAALEVPAVGYGIRYQFGIFTQLIRDGWQAEATDTWLRFGNPWEIRRPNISYEVKLGGHTERHYDDSGRQRVVWIPGETFRGVAIDTPILGFEVNMVNHMRLWSAEASDGEGFDFTAFNQGDYYAAVVREVRTETISKVLYPNDEPEVGRRLRLLQQHFFVSCSLQDMIRIHLTSGQPLDRLHEKYAVQLNDTHPAIAVAELMRLLVDEHDMPWDTAWGVTTRMFAYTNHTLLPEALEKWPVPLFADLLPRHLEIIYEINAAFLEQIRHRYPGDDARIARMSIIDESGPRYVRMAYLASVGALAVNGVAELHSRLLQETVLKDFHDFWPRKFQNKTNGVTPRRFIMMSNPGLTKLLNRTLGTTWHKDLFALKALEAKAGDAEFQHEWRKVKLDRKKALAKLVRDQLDLIIDPDSLFDIQAKRIHEYKRQHLNVLNIIALYQRIKRNPSLDIQPRTFLFGGKSAPGYFMAKLIIKLIHSVGEVVNHDKDVAGRIKVAFVPNYSVKVAQWVYPAADLSEQISTAGKEASGTGNMKFSMNGALTIGTLDGANVEIREEVGAENFFLFGLTAEEVAATFAAGYRPRDFYDNNDELRAVIDLIGDGHFSNGDRDLFRPLVEHLLNWDTYLLMADFASYIDCQDRVSAAYRDKTKWTSMSILNAARMGKFSSDRTIREYCRDIWKVEPVKISLE
jgi:starch phosphorylase